MMDLSSSQTVSLPEGKQPFFLGFFPMGFPIKMRIHGKLNMNQKPVTHSQCRSTPQSESACVCGLIDRFDCECCLGYMSLLVYLAG